MDAEYEPVEPFGIDDGQLDDLSPAECFTLGVEWEMVRTRLASGEGFECPLHAANRDRVAAMLDRHGRRHEVRFLHDDVSEAWVWLSVQPGEEPPP